MARLYIVSTPIGNLGDITYRAIEVLGRADRILAEDTRRTAILLRHYGITTPLVSAHAHNEAARAEQLLTWLDGGEEVALVSDAGTPLLSDPGARIVQRVVAAGHDVVPIPGASALLAALVASGFDPAPFTFYGFLPRSGRGRRTILDAIASLDHAAVLYEAPGRLTRLLRDLAAAGCKDRRVVVARELTKVYETFVRGTLEEALRYYEREPARGEVTVVLDGRPKGHTRLEANEAGAAALVRTLLDEGQRPSDAAKEVARRLGIPRNRAYELVLKETRGDEGD